jgi:acyl-CoA dehydrogenase
VCSVSGMRRALDLARDYAGRRRAFGALLIDKPLHVDTLAGLEAEAAAAFLLAFRAVTVLGASASTAAARTRSGCCARSRRSPS